MRQTLSMRPGVSLEDIAATPGPVPTDAGTSLLAETSFEPPRVSPT
ncbi:hypothetical protein [Mesobaculum littorinae]|nr:hypothetical protein [Mesobaculum littorinae]